MNLKSKFIGSEDERAVSPVIGVILMVAITVILAAVIAAFVLDLGQSTGANAQAGISFDEDGDDVTTTLSSIDRADRIYMQIDVDEDGDLETYYVDKPNDDAYDVSESGVSSEDASDFDVGDAYTLNTTSPDETLDIAAPGGESFDNSEDDIVGITIIGVLDGNEAVIATWD